MTNERLPALNAETLPAIIESILFVAEAPVEVTTLVRALHRPRGEVDAALDAIEARLTGGGIFMQRKDGEVQLATIPEAGPYIERFLGAESKQRLSTAALEALGIIAYRQPTTRSSVEAIRGVNSDGAINSLINRGLVEDVGRANTPGRPVLLGTTMKFFEHFGLKDKNELPPLPAGIEMGEAAFGKPANHHHDGHDNRNLSSHATFAGERLAEGQAHGPALA